MASLSAAGCRLSARPPSTTFGSARWRAGRHESGRAACWIWRGCERLNRATARRRTRCTRCRAFQLLMRVLATLECALIRARLLGILRSGHAGRMEELSLHLRDGVRRQPAQPGPLPNARTCAGDFRAPMQPSTPGPPAAWHGTDQRSKALAACCARQGSGEDESPSRRCGRRDQCLMGHPLSAVDTSAFWRRRASRERQSLERALHVAFGWLAALRDSGTLWLADSLDCSSRARSSRCRIESRTTSIRAIARPTSLAVP